MSEITKTAEQILSSLNEASKHEVSVRQSNNELYHLTQGGEMTMDMLAEIDRVQAEKARALFMGYAEANPQSVAAIQSVIAAGLSSGEHVDTLDVLASILEDLLQEKSEILAQDSMSPRVGEVALLIEAVEKIFVVHATEMRAANPQWWMGV